MSGFRMFTVLQSTSEIRTVRFSNGHVPDAFWVWFSNGNKMADNLKSGQICPDFEWSDRFIHKRKNFFIIKRNIRPFEKRNLSATGQKLNLKTDHGSVFRWSLYSNQQVM